MSPDGETTGIFNCSHDVTSSRGLPAALHGEVATPDERVTLLADVFETVLFLGEEPRDVVAVEAGDFGGRGEVEGLVAAFDFELF